MTREKAIRYFQFFIGKEDYTDYHQDACKMAIASLRNQSHKGIEAIEGMCCDCVYGERCCDYSENKKCEHYKEDGSCWTPYPPAKLDRSRWEGCKDCKRQWGVLHDRTSRFEIRRKMFCGSCGRPLTEEAWAELERRMQ